MILLLLSADRSQIKMGSWILYISQLNAHVHWDTHEVSGINMFMMVMMPMGASEMNTSMMMSKDESKQMMYMMTMMAMMQLGKMIPIGAMISKM